MTPYEVVMMVKVTSYTRIAKGLQIGTSKVQVKIRKYKCGKKRR